MAVQAENGRGCHSGSQNNPLTTSSTLTTNSDPAKLLDLGPQYIRNRYISMEPGMKRRNRRSAVELLEETKSLYVKSESVLDAKQVPKNADNLQVRQRRSAYGLQSLVDGGSRLSELWAKPDSTDGSSPGQGSSGHQWSGTAEGSSSSSSSSSSRSSSGSSSSGQPTPTAETPATALGGGGGGGGALTGTSRLDQCHNITSGNIGGIGSTGAHPAQTVLANNREQQKPEPGETASATPATTGHVLNQEGGERNKGLKRANSQNCPKCLHLAGRPCEECCKKRNKVPAVEGGSVSAESFIRDSGQSSGVPNVTTTNTTTTATASTTATTSTPPSSSSASSTASRPPPPVPPKPTDHQPLQHLQPGARQPPPVPPKHRSVSSSSDNAGSGTSNATPPPVPPKPGDRSSFYQEKLPPPPVLPKPSSATTGSSSNPAPPTAPRRATYNGMEGGPSTDGLSKASMEPTPHHTGSQSTPPPVPPKPKPSLMASDAWRDAHTDTSSEIDQHSNSSLVKVDDKLVVVRRRPRKFHRSRSDLTKRFSNSSDLSELSARFSRNSADLEKFFNEMGLDRSVLEPMMMNACQRSASDLHLFESASSIESPDIRSWCSDDDVENPLKHEAVEERTPPVGQSSIVERNARIIKWLCSVKKAASHEEPLTEQ